MKTWYEFVSNNYYLITGVLGVILSIITMKIGYDFGKDRAYNEMYKETLETENELLKELLEIE